MQESWLTIQKDTNKKYSKEKLFRCRKKNQPKKVWFCYGGKMVWMYNLRVFPAPGTHLAAKFSSCTTKFSVSFPPKI